MAVLKLSALALLSAHLFTGVLAGPKECPAGGELSCQNDTVVEDTCCFNHPGGLVLLTQFWDADPATGPEDSWTVHGLWPDNCDGSYESNCDPEREHENIEEILENHGQGKLVEEMKTFWKDNNGDDESLWSHEWNKHGTCMSTLEVDCYADYAEQEEVKDYFVKAMELFRGLDTYNVLADAGITPSADKTYALDDLQSAISEKHGLEVTLNCRDGELNEVWYFYNIKGSVQSGEYVAAEPAGASSSCPDQGIKYLPKQKSQVWI